jgi:hypothetical protein
MANNNPTVYNVLLYGAKPAKSLSDGVTNSTTTFTSATANFTSADVGKLIQINGAAGSSGTLKTTIASVSNATTVILTTGASSSHTGVIFTYGVDSTASIQSTINTCEANLGGTVWFPNGIYLIAGALVTSDNNGNNPNSQLYIPARDGILTALDNSITLQGESAIFNFGGGYGTTSAPLTNTGVILKSIISGSGTNPSVIGTVGVGTFAPFMYTNVFINDICVEVYSNSGTAAPTMSGINMQNASRICMRNTSAILDIINQSSVTPASNEVAGMLISNISNGGPNYIDNCAVSGFKYGYFGSEHSEFQNCYASACVYPLVCPNTNYLIKGRFSFQGTINAIYFPTSTTMGYLCGTGSFVDILMEYENDNGGFWYDASGIHITDSGNNGHGTIRARIGSSGTFGITGGTNLNIWNLTGNVALSPTTLAAPLTMSDGSNTLQDLGSFRNTNTGSSTGGAISVYNNNGNTPSSNGLHLFLFSSAFNGFNNGAALINYENGVFLFGTNNAYFMNASAAGAMAIGKGATAPVASAQLEIVSTTKGLLIPVMTTTQRNAISSPADGLMVYDSTLHTPYWYLNGTWTPLPTSGSYTPTLTNTANITTSALNQAYYTRVGNIVTVTIGGTMTPTAAATTTLTFTLPITSSNGTQSFVGSGSQNMTASWIPGNVSIVSTTTGQWTLVTTSFGFSQAFSFTFQYTL